MKKNDIALLILIASIALVASYFAMKAIVGDPKQKSVQVETIERFSTDVTQPDASVFNDGAINPTVETKIGNPSNQQPF